MQQDIHVNFLAVGAAAVASYILAAIWYGAVFSKAWMRLTGITEMKPAPSNIIFMLIGSFIMAYVLQHSIVFGDGYFKAYFKIDQTLTISNALQGAFFIWLGFVAITTMATKLYEKKPWGLWVLDNAFWLISLMMQATILTVWPRNMVLS